MTTDSVQRRGRRHALSLNATAGFALTLAASAGGMAWWAAHEEADLAVASQRDRLSSVGKVLASGAADLISQGHLPLARRMLLEGAAKAGIESYKLMLPDGSVIASNEPGDRPAESLPEEWPLPRAGAELSVEPTIEETDGTLVLNVPIKVEGRGAVTLQARARSVSFDPAASDLMIGIGVCAALGLAGFAVSHRLATARLGGLLRVASALRDAARGEQAVEVLRVDPDAGPEAVGWNAVLDEREIVAAGLLEQRSLLAAKQGGHAHGDLAPVCDAMSLGLLVVDPAMKFSYANGAAAVMLGLRREELSEGDVSLLPDAKIAEAVRAATTGTSRQRVTLEVERGGADGQTPKGVLKFVIRALRREDTAAALITIEDVTQQKVAEHSRNSFVTQVTHELRTPLTNIRLYVEMLTDDQQLEPKERARAINVIGQESRRLERVVSDMLSVSEMEAGAFTLHRDDVRVEEIIHDAQEDFKAQADDKEIQLEFVLPPKLSVLHADRDKLSLAVHNLVGNALKYTPAGGKVKVTVEEDAGGISVSVADNGIGIKPEESDLIFEKFYRAKDKRIAGITGSGLGLAMARQVARLHGGDITVCSQVDKGSTFVISLPIAKAA